MKFTNCLGCGAPLHDLKCPYCGNNYERAFELEMAKNRTSVPAYTSTGVQPMWMTTDLGVCYTSDAIEVYPRYRR